MFIFTVLAISCFWISIANAEAASDAGETNVGNSPKESQYMDYFPWLNEQEGQAPLSRKRRSASNDTGDKSIWDEIEEFYSDKNNMAMYCVLPIMVLIYGGCASIYCVHKCRQYIKRRKHKRLKEEDCDSLNSDKNDLNQNDKSTSREDDRPISQISNAWTDMNESNGNVKWSGQTEASDSTSPLPWQVPEKTTAAAMLTQQNVNRSSYVSDRLRDDEISLEEGRRSQASLRDGRSASRTSTLDDTLIDEELNHGSRSHHHHSENVKIVSAAAAANSDNFGESTDDRPNLPPLNLQPHPQKYHQAQQQRQKPRLVGNDESRREANLNDYTAKSSKIKATDYSRFAEAKPIEIVPLTADPSLRVWDPLHRRPWGEKGQSRNSSRVQPMGAEGSKDGSVNQMKEEMLARYDALSTFQMAKKAAEILKTNAVEKSPFKRKPNKKKHIFIAE